MALSSILFENSLELQKYFEGFQICSVVVKVV